jgi:YD repeat-containing protein
VRYANTVERSYDAAGRLLTERLTGTTAALKGTWTVATAYDADNRIVRITSPDGRRTDRTYTDRNQLATVSDDGVLVASRSYDDAGRLTSSTLGNGLVETRVYEPNSPLVSAIAIPGATSFSYSYDANRRKTVESNVLTPSQSQNFGYDDADRLTTWSEGPNVQSWTLSPNGIQLVLVLPLGCFRTRDSLRFGRLFAAYLTRSARSSAIASIRFSDVTEPSMSRRNQSVTMMNR